MQPKSFRQSGERANMNKPRSADPAIRRELRRIRAEHTRLVGYADAEPVMHRLATLRAKFAQLDQVIQRAGGASEATALLVAELRQLSKGCSSLEAQLNRMGMFDRPRSDSFALLGLARQQLLARGKAEAINGQTIPALEHQPAEHRPLSTAALIAQLDRDEVE